MSCSLDRIARLLAHVHDRGDAEGFWLFAASSWMDLEMAMSRCNCSLAGGSETVCSAPYRPDRNDVAIASQSVRGDAGIMCNVTILAKRRR